MTVLGILYKKMEIYFFKIYIYITIFGRIFEKIMFLLTTSVLLAIEGYFAYQVKWIEVLYTKIKFLSKKRISKKFRLTFWKKNWHFTYLYESMWCQGTFKKKCLKLFGMNFWQVLISWKSIKLVFLIFIFELHWRIAKQKDSLHCSSR